MTPPPHPTLSSLTAKSAVREAIREYDKLTREVFLAKYGYGKAKNYFVVYRGEHYDSKAIAGVAVGKQHGRAMLNSEFNGGAATVVPLLDRLGFKVVAVRLDERAAALPEEVQGRFSEGAVRTVTVNRWERSADARVACIEAHGATCVCCGMSFGRTYGDAFTGLIHVHHLVRGADLVGIRNVDARKDLVPVCPNCHAAIHHGGKNRSVADIQRVLGSGLAPAG